MSFGFATLPWSTTTFPPPRSTTFCCNCQSCGSFSGSIIETHICSRCNLACVLSDEHLEGKLIIGSKRKVQRGKCFESKLWAYGLTLPPPPSPPPPAPLNTLLFCCKVMSVPAATLLKGISLFHVGCFFLRRVLAVHGQRLRWGPGNLTVMVAAAMGKTFWLRSPLKSRPLSRQCAISQPSSAHSPIAECVRI